MLTLELLSEPSDSMNKENGRNFYMMQSLRFFGKLSQDSYDLGI
jgi:hypothetical protein